jgi:hypothetical protein
LKPLVSSVSYKPINPGSYFQLGIIGTVPRAYNIFKACEGMEGRKNKNEVIKNRKI